MTPGQRIECILHFDKAEFRRLSEWNVKVGIYMIQHFLYNLAHPAALCAPLATENNLFRIALIGDILVEYQAAIALYEVARACQDKDQTVPDNPQRL